MSYSTYIPNDYLEVLKILREDIVRTKQVITKRMQNEIKLREYSTTYKGLTLEEHAIKIRIRNEIELQELRKKHKLMSRLTGFPSFQPKADK